MFYKKNFLRILMYFPKISCTNRQGKYSVKYKLRLRDLSIRQHIFLVPDFRKRLLQETMTPDLDWSQSEMLPERLRLFPCLWAQKRSILVEKLTQNPTFTPFKNFGNLSAHAPFDFLRNLHYNNFAVGKTVALEVIARACYSWLPLFTAKTFLVFLNVATDRRKLNSFENWSYIFTQCKMRSKRVIIGNEIWAKLQILCVCNTRSSFWYLFFGGRHIYWQATSMYKIRKRNGMNDHQQKYSLIHQFLSSRLVSIPIFEGKWMVIMRRNRTSNLIILRRQGINSCTWSGIIHSILSWIETNWKISKRRCVSWSLWKTIRNNFYKVKKVGRNWEQIQIFLQLHQVKLWEFRKIFLIY